MGKKKWKAYFFTETQKIIKVDHQNSEKELIIGTDTLVFLLQSLGFQSFSSVK